jgi:DNA polymerase theta
VSFAEPNLQNVPRDFEIDLPTVIAESPPQGAQSTNRGYRKVTHVNNAPGAKFAVSMRTAFIPFKGGILLAADYSQLELRLIAHLSRDERLLKLLNTGGDVFRMIAGSLNGIERAAVSDEQRQRAKQICYGIIYGIGARSLGEQLGLSEEDASVYIEKFKSRFSGIKKYLKTTVEGCRKNGFVVTVSNRRRYLPAINSTNVHARSQAERQAVNTTVQGSAADLVKIAMINIDRKLTEIYSSCRRTHRHNNNEKDELEISRRKSTRISAQTPRRGSSAQSIQGAHVVLQLHDELILEVAEEDLDRVAAIVKKEMENAIKLSVVLPIKLKAGPSWGTMNPLEL